MSNQSKADVQRHYGRLNKLFWMGVLGIVLGPVLMLVVAAIAFKIAGSNVSAPIGLCSPFAAVAAIALALMVRSSRRIARRSLEKAKFAESVGYQYLWKPTSEETQMLQEMSLWDNPTSFVVTNLICTEQDGVDIQIADVRSEHFYGAATAWSEQTVLMFPDAVSDEFELRIMPKGRADKMLGKLVNYGADQRFSKLPLAANYHIGCEGNIDMSALFECLTALTPLFQKNPQLCLAAENGNLILFSEMKLLSAPEIRPMLATSWTALQAFSRLN
ncbi:MAG: hypothetical protein JNM43_27330 [Planctomycetaceae bacterium]|nr:hypothetical protein [Planctomycetaceae bacterium]